MAYGVGGFLAHAISYEFNMAFCGWFGLGSSYFG
jgi:hypothetical protein